ncbi:MAG: FHA domain-containing protein [Deltaproteobacteria bacterium]|nr:FHA domain-containing protein [Deltaproteobacteria bacterium]
MEGESTRIETDHLIAEEATSILEQPAARPYLRVELGKDKDKEFVLNPGEIGVGRSIDNDVILTDIAVSRRHLTIVVSDAGLLKIVDLGSGNGSTVNGSRVREAPLNQGDRIELGETTLVVEIPGQQETTGPRPGAPVQPGAPVPAPMGMDGGDTTDQTSNPSEMPPGTPTTGGLAGAGIPPHAAAPISTDYIAAPKASPGPFGIPRPWLFAFLAVGGIIVALVGATITALVLRDDGNPSGSVAYNAAFNAGMVAMEAQDWETAHEQFSLATREDPGDHRANQHLQEVIRVREELLAIGRAQDALSGESPDASAALGELQAVRPESPVVSRANAVKDRAKAVQAAGYLAEALAAVEAGDTDTAREKLPVLDSLASDVESAREAAAAVRAALGDEAGETVASAGSTMRRGPWRPSGRGPSSSPSPSMGRTMTSGSSSSMRGGSGSSALNRARSQVLAQFQSRNFSQARQLAEALGNDMESSSDQRVLLALGSKIRRFEREFTIASRPSATPRQMASAIDLEQEIVGIDASFTNSIKARLISSYLRSARAALRSNPTSACRDVLAALDVDRRNSAVMGLLRECMIKVEEMMCQADDLAARDLGRARTIYGQVHQMVPDGPLRVRAYRARNSMRDRDRDEDE